jgi:hypothetical protein
MRAASCARIAMQVIAASILPSFAFNKRRVPQPPADITGRTNSFACRNKVRLFCVISEAQY